MVQLVKNLPANAGDAREVGVTLDWGEPLEKELATHSIIPAWRIPRTEEPGGRSPWGCKGIDTTEHTHMLSSMLIFTSPK